MSTNTKSRRTSLQSLFFLFTLALAALLGGCGGASTPGLTDLAVQSISVSLPAGDSASSPIPVGHTLQLTATETLIDGSTINATGLVSWTSSHASVATVSSDGLVTVVSAGTTVITATAGDKSSSVTLTGAAASVQSIAVTPSTATIALGDTQQFTATATNSDGSTQDVSSTVTWTTSPTGIATVSSAGLAQSVAQGSTTITATLGSVTSHASLSVGPKVVVSIAVTPSSPTIPLGETQQFTATATYSDGTTGNVTSSTTWGASPSSVLTINSSGLAHAVGQGSFTLTATNGSQNANLSGTVGSAVATGIQVNPGSASIPKNATQTFHAVANMSDGTTQDVTPSTTWASSNTAAATVSSSGVATGVSAGSAQITGTYQTFSGTASLTVTNATVQSVSVAPSTASIAKGSTQQFTATANLSDGSTQNVTSLATWSSSSTTVATINSAGLATAVNPGSTTVSAQYGSQTGNAALTVTAATLVSVVITPTNPSAPSGGTLQLTATGTFSDGTTQNVTSSLTYSSSNVTVAFVDSSGVLHGVSPGTATITASEGSFSTQFTVTTSSATLQSIAVTPASPTIVAGSTQQFAATGTYSDGSTQDLTATAVWTSSSPLVATVLNGLATGLTAGTTTITAAVQTISGSADLTVSPATITTITVAPSTATVAAGQTQAFTATATLSDATTQDVTASAHWAVANPLVAVVSNNPGTAGTATGLAAGSTQVSATVNLVSGTANLTVTAATVTSVAVTPSTASIALGTQTTLTATATYSDGSTANVTDSAIWTSSNPTVAAVVFGVVTPLITGTTNATATLQSHSGSSAITVTAATLTSIAISPTSVTMPLGQTSQMSATGTYSDSTTQNITSLVHWTSSLPAVATVSSTGLVSGVAPGASVITATLGSVTQTAGVTIDPASLQSIEVTTPQSSLPLGLTLQLSATGLYSDGSTQNLTNVVQWASSDPSVGVVSLSGLASGVLAGSFTASATTQGVTGQASITITPATLVSLSISPTGSLSALLSHQMTLTGHYSDGTTQTISNGVHWAVSNTLLASISQTGLLLPLGLGSINVTATYGSLSSQVTLSLI